jgi:predicted MFS family arabinose efflux permease
MRAAVPGMALAVLGLFNIAGSVAAGFVVQPYSMRGTLATLFIARMLAIGLFLVARKKTAFTVLAFSASMGLPTWRCFRRRQDSSASCSAPTACRRCSA